MSRSRRNKVFAVVVGLALLVWVVTIIVVKGS